MPESDNRLKHILIRGTVTSEEYTSPNQIPRPRYPERQRQEHAAYLLNRLREVQQVSQQRRDSLPVRAPAPDGIYLEFESKPGFDLTIKSLDLPSHGVELLSVKKVTEDNEEKTLATVFVPDEKISIFIKKVEDYRDAETSSGKPKNRPLIDSIQDLRVAVVKSLWTDLIDIFPSSDEMIWWEIWLRATSDAIPRFQNFAQARDINLSPRILQFPDRHVVLAYTSASILATSIESLSFIAELRRAKETTSEFLQMTIQEQQQWIDTLKDLLDPPFNNAPTVCILDTGIAKHHLLIDPFLPASGLHSCNPTWGTHDHDGHGTGMAGLVLYGNLENALLSTTRIKVPSEIESVKILPVTGANHPELYGSITEEAVSRATVPAPNKERIVCMAITSSDSRDRGQPSSWSAALDKICAGLTVEHKRHLFLVSAGNVIGDHLQYPDTNLTECIHDPGQSWNALTVGAYTQRANITEPSFSGWTPLAPVGDIAPATTGSLTWEKNKWPVKPDVVLEGGNAAINQNRTEVDYPDSLALLTLSHETSRSSFTWISDTSAATAEAANMAGKIGSLYPDYWPETIRGIIIHSADWTPRMRLAYPTTTKNNRETLLRICGYGVPSLEKALWSARNHLTLIAQDEIQPFDGNSMKEMNLHNIPWPADVLRSLGETVVRMRVTLSYFIEPNPARRGWEYKFRYQSHGLRFDVKTSLETQDEFITRLNRERWDEEQGRGSVTSRGDSDKWFLGKQIRSKGSIHSDWWEGTAASLAERSQIAIYPVVGWWRERHSEGHTRKKARYSMIVTIDSPETTVDIYTPVATMISTQIQTTIE
jgi:hypothetical protein